MSKCYALKSLNTALVESYIALNPDGSVSLIDSSKFNNPFPTQNEPVCIFEFEIISSEFKQGWVYIKLKKELIESAVEIVNTLGLAKPEYIYLQANPDNSIGFSAIDTPPDNLSVLWEIDTVFQNSILMCTIKSALSTPSKPYYLNTVAGGTSTINLSNQLNVPSNSCIFWSLSILLKDESVLFNYIDPKPNPLYQSLTFKKGVFALDTTDRSMSSEYSFYIQSFLSFFACLIIVKHNGVPIGYLSGSEGKPLYLTPFGAVNSANWRGYYDAAWLICYPESSSKKPIPILNFSTADPKNAPGLSANNLNGAITISSSTTSQWNVVLNPIFTELSDKAVQAVETLVLKQDQKYLSDLCYIKARDLFLIGSKNELTGIMENENGAWGSWSISPKSGTNLSGFTVFETSLFLINDNSIESYNLSSCGANTPPTKIDNTSTLKGKKFSDPVFDTVNQLVFTLTDSGNVVGLPPDLSSQFEYTHEPADGLPVGPLELFLKVGINKEIILFFFTEYRQVELKIDSKNGVKAFVRLPDQSISNKKFISEKYRFKKNEDLIGNNYTQVDFRSQSSPKYVFKGTDFVLFSEYDSLLKRSVVKLLTGGTIPVFDNTKDSISPATADLNNKFSEYVLLNKDNETVELAKPPIVIYDSLRSRYKMYCLTLSPANKNELSFMKFEFEASNANNQQWELSLNSLNGRLSNLFALKRKEVADELGQRQRLLDSCVNQYSSSTQMDPDQYNLQSDYLSTFNNPSSLEEMSLIEMLYQYDCITE